MTPTSRRRYGRRTATAVIATGLALSVASCGGNLSSGGGDGADYPRGAVNLLVGQDPGGSTDLIARALAEGAKEPLGVAMPVVNTPGANGALAANELAGEEPDGQNLMVLNASLAAITPLAVAADEAVDVADFEVITGISRDDYVLVTAESSDFDTLKDVTGDDGGLKFGTTGVGTGSQLAQELLFRQAEIESTPVPFDGGAPTLTAVLGGQVDMGVVQVGEAMPQIEAGELTALATFAEKRNEFLPDVPAAAEEGYDVRVSQYRAVVAPKGTPEEVVRKLRSAFTDVFATEEYKGFNEDNYFTPHEVKPAQVAKEWTGFKDEYATMVEEYGIDLGSES